MGVRNKPNELQITRIYDAPVKAVWDAWTDPKQVAKWWGPRGFTLTTHSKDLKPGGNWIYTMHGPDGTDYPNITTYHEIERYKKLVYDHGANETQGALFRVTVLFSESKGKTKMEMTMTLPTPEAAQEAKKFVKAAGGNATWDRLAEFLEKESTGKERFVINRSFEAPIETIYEMWTNPDHFAKWLPPVGLTMKYLRAEIRTGGRSFFQMTNGKDIEMYGHIEYKELRAPDRIVYLQGFCDKNEAPSRHPFAPHWPEKMKTVVTLAEEGPNETRVTVEWEPLEGCIPDELAAFAAERGGMTQGWNGSFDKLDELLK